MTILYRLLFAILVILNLNFSAINSCATPYCCSTRDGSGPTPPVPPVPGVAGISFMNSLGNHNGPSVGNIGGNISTTGVTAYITKKNADDCLNIQTPGVYLLAESLILPDNDSDDFDGCTSGITISTSDVTIDLNGFSINYGGQTGPPFQFHGIKIAPGVKNITIKNGAIRGFTGSGIYAASTTGTAGAIQQIVLCDLMIQDNAAGVTFDGTLNPLKLVHITTSTISSNKSYGVSYTSVNTGKFSSVTTSENSNSAGHAHGIWLANCNNIDLYAADTEKNTATGGTGYGVLADTCNKINIYSSNANYNTGDTEIGSYGIALVNSTNSTLDSNTVGENNIGFYDNASPTSNLYIRNFAKRNGPFTSPAPASNSTLLTNYNIIAAPGGVAVDHDSNTTALNKFIKKPSIHAPHDADNAGTYWNYSFTD